MTDLTDTMSDCPIHGKEPDRSGVVEKSAYDGLSEPDAHVCADGMAAPVWTPEVAAALAELEVEAEDA